MEIFDYKVYGNVGSREKRREAWFKKLAYTVAEMATCPRRHVGAILVREGRIIAQGYNGSPPGEPHCDDVGCELDANGKCVRTSHAEANMLATCARFGIATDGASVYVTTKPCRTCEKLLHTAGIEAIRWYEDYEDPTVRLDNSQT